MLVRNSIQTSAKFEKRGRNFLQKLQSLFLLHTGSDGKCKNKRMVLKSNSYDHDIS